MLYKNIQGLRAVAALMVMFAHIYPALPMQAHWTLPYVSTMGPGGVDLFFVISGFVVYLSADRLGKKAEIVGRWLSFREFTVKRVFRIYPVYWVAFFVASVLLLTTTLVVAPPEISERPLWGLLLLIDQPNNRIGAAWTLQYEVTFYAICALAILLFPRRILLMLGPVAVAVFLGWVAGIVKPTAYLFLEFVFGIVVALLVQRKISGHAASSLAVGVGGILIGAVYFYSQGGWWVLGHMWRVLCFGLPSAFIVYGLVAMEIRAGWVFSRLWVGVGDSSYSLYLWHYPLFAVLAACYADLGIMSRVPVEVLALTSCSIAVLFGFVSYYGIERPINKSGWVARLAGTTGNKPAPMAADLKAEMA
ncbi:acyltransferase family protein [Mesorhizobium japonicum]|uniref:Mlr8032 protein n=1 Tax=Mesorhizobium japonicum (strain LMG 29417 / CECT 9101 / MAFF 303099) TaxID=266835 RepID=Q984F1_RHILO|nr:acyltransferase [Mesorhizobium japonicum]BAB53679.1 mlr8032 [Mesorhizobium japonicum MAFF 303099]